MRRPDPVESVAAIASLVQSLAATFAARYQQDGRLPAAPRTLIAENKWRAARYGLDTELADFARDTVRPAAKRLGCEEEFAEVQRLCARGTGADEQREVEERDGSLLAVAQWLAAETVPGLE